MWSRRCSKWAVLIGAGVLEAACSTSHVAKTTPSEPAAQVAAATAASSAPLASGTSAANAAAPVAPPPPRAIADFTRAVALARSGKDEEAELEFQQVANGYPQYPGALVNLGLLYRKHGELAKSDQSLHAAVERDANDAEAWCELGVTLRQEGKFHDAVDAYNHAIGADPNFAPAYRNLAIVLDLYLGDTGAALTAMQRYKDLGADDKAITGWLADLKQRAGKNAAPAASSAPAATDKAGG